MRVPSRACGAKRTATGRKGRAPSCRVLIGESEEPARLKGYGPITAGQAREIAFAKGTIWRRLIIEPKTGMLVKTDLTTYKPTAETERHVIARDGRCTFPSCQMPAHRCDLDHIQPFSRYTPQAGGQTVPENLGPLCRRHHLMKTRHPGWRVTRDADTGITTWTAPTGHTYTNPPHNYLEWTPSPQRTGSPDAALRGWLRRRQAKSSSGVASARIHGPTAGHTGGKGMGGMDGGIPVRTIFRRRESAAPRTLDIYDIAYLAGGPRGVVQTALITLRERGAIKLAGRRVRALRAGKPADHPVERALIELCHPIGKYTLPATAKVLSGPEVKGIGRRLASYGLLSRSRRRLTPAGERELESAKEEGALPAYVFDGPAALPDRRLRSAVRAVPYSSPSLLQMGRAFELAYEDEDDTGSDGGSGSGSDWGSHSGSGHASCGSGCGGGGGGD
ncbi:TIGR04222 domain-containing membrane protein [Streptomyces sp. ME19-01-6]|uniref:TIGR04222 domain-containing membrane protein n=1 Tax=Streptomyces sp. ME19-01-6 TaxID=3028686 RepID=UPI0029AC847E|nr:TIGR04222 domain-containing membrane protein [Streptomyces sp. ME19-01-6]MDX3224456.1 TIGR04222 domain-containing membrane protein [Streptomyces sp. ME19-01-6]